VRVLDALDHRHDAERHDEKDCEDRKRDQLWEGLVDVPLVPVVEACQLHWKPDQHTDYQGQDFDDHWAQNPQLVDQSREDYTEIEYVVEEVVV